MMLHNKLNISICMLSLFCLWLQVLKCLGPAALKEVIQTAEKYEACQLHRLN